MKLTLRYFLEISIPSPTRITQATAVGGTAGCQAAYHPSGKTRKWRWQYSSDEDQIQITLLTASCWFKHSNAQDLIPDQWQELEHSDSWSNHLTRTRVQFANFHTSLLHPITMLNLIPSFLDSMAFHHFSKHVQLRKFCNCCWCCCCCCYCQGVTTKVQISPAKQTKFVRGGGFCKNHAWCFKWSFAHTMVWQLKPEMRTFVCLRGGRELQVKPILFVSLSFFELLQ